MAILPDLIRPGLDIVFCGTAASTASARAGAYYAGPGNRFWETLHAVGLTPRRLEPHEYPELLSHGIGLTDLAKQAHGNDASLKSADFDRERLKSLIFRNQPALLAFTSKSAASRYSGERVNYGLASYTLGPTRVFVLPSPSGAARRYWDPSIWRQLAAVRGQIPDAVR